MDIAQAKRKENIAEYILYLWQLEDLLRALQFSPEAIYSQLVAPRQVDEEQKHLYLLWYMDIVNLLRKEGKEENGHLEHTLHLIGDMHNLHLQLMQNPIGEHYRKTFARLAPVLPQLRTLVKKDNISDTMAKFLNEVPQPFADQDAWNKYGIEQDKVAVAPVRFNECISCGYTSDPAIVHYCAVADWYESHNMFRRNYLEKYLR